MGAGSPSCGNVSGRLRSRELIRCGCVAEDIARGAWAKEDGRYGEVGMGKWRDFCCAAFFLSEMWMMLPQQDKGRDIRL